MSKIQNAFASGKAFIPFITCGDPDLDTTAKLVRAMAEAGADLIQLGIPFSDPTAEGPVVQDANLRALSAGTTTDKIFSMLQELRKDVSVPLVLMGYANVVFSYGTERFLSACAQAGVDGLILPDVPYEEKEEFAPLCRQYGLDLISIVSHTSGDRAAMIAKEAEGFVYLLADPQDVESACDIAALIRDNAQVPCVVGADELTVEQVSALARCADGVAVAAAVVELLAQHRQEALPHVDAYVRERKQAIG